MDSRMPHWFADNSLSIGLTPVVRLNRVTDGAGARAEEIAAADPSGFVQLQRFKNPANPAIYEKTTGPEIWEDTDGAVDIFVAGVGAGFVPGVLDLSLIDSVEQIGNGEAVQFARRLAVEESILSGISCGAAAAVAVKLAKRPESVGKAIVVIVPDSGESYLSSALFEGLFDAKGIAA